MNNNICFIHYRSKDQTSLDGPMDNCLNIPWIVHCKNCGVLCPPNEQHTIGVISHRPWRVCLAHLIWCARS